MVKFPIKISLSTHVLYALFFSTILLVSMVPFLLSLMPERNYLILMIFLRTILVFSALIIPALIVIKQITKQTITKIRAAILGTVIFASIMSVALLSEALIWCYKAVSLEQERSTLWCELLISTSSSNENWESSFARLKNVIKEQNELGKSFESKSYLYFIMPVVRICTSGSLFQKNDTAQPSQEDEYVLVGFDSEDSKHDVNID